MEQQMLESIEKEFHSKAMQYRGVAAPQDAFEFGIIEDMDDLKEFFKFNKEYSPGKGITRVLEFNQQLVVFFMCGAPGSSEYYVYIHDPKTGRNIFKESITMQLFSFTKLVAMLQRITT